MSVLTVPPRTHVTGATPVIAVDMPVLYEDEGQEEMGDARYHSTTQNNLYYALAAHFADRPGHEVLADMNLYYHPIDLWAYVSPDVMVVRPPVPLSPGLTSYRIGESGPAPVLTVEVLSRRTFQQGDLTMKPGLYADLGVSEYLLVDVTGVFLPERLLLKVLDSDKTWINVRDQGMGVESRTFGFAVQIELDGQVRVTNTVTGRPYPRPEEAAEEAQARAAAELALRRESEARQAAEAELARLRALLAEKSK
jgi:Uma2 family endonuclease